MIGKKSLFVLISRTTTRLLQSILYIIAVNYFLPSEFGYQKIAVSLMGFFVLITTLGLEKPYIKIYAENEGNKKNEVFTTFFITRIGLTIIASAVIVSIFLFQVRHEIVSNDTELTWIFFILFLKFLFYSVNMVYNLSFRSELNVSKTEIPNLVGGISGVIFSFLAIFISQNFLLYIFGQTLTEMIKFCMFLFIKRNFKFTKFNSNIFKKLFLLNLVFLIPIGLETLKTNLGPFFFLQYFDNELLGVYSVIANLFLIIKELQKTLGFLFIPNFTKLLLKGDHQTIKKQIDRFEKYLLIINGMIIIGGIFLAKLILNFLLGEIYYNQGILYFYGSLIYLLNLPINGAYTHLLIAAEKMKVYTINALCSFLTSLIFWIFLIPQLNILALDLGKWIAGIICAIFIRIFTQKHLKVGKMEKTQKFNLLILSVLIPVSFIFAQIYFSFWMQILITFIFITFYIIILFLLKILVKEDIRYVIDVIFPKQVATYIKNDAIKFLLD